MNTFVLESDILEIIQFIHRPSENFAGKNVLLTGARGFLGRYFIEIFKKLNELYLNPSVKIFAVDNFITAGEAGHQFIDDPNIKFIQHDIIKPLELQEPIHYVIHMAGIASPRYYLMHPLETLDVSTIGTKNLLELAKKDHSRFTFFSSSEIYGEPDNDNIPTLEEYRGSVSTQGPRSCYDEGKRVGETFCYIYHEYFGVKTTIVRPFNIFGPGMGENDFRVLPNFASRLKGKKSLNVYAKGNQTRTYCYITDAMISLFLVILNGIPGDTYNIGNPAPEISVLELVSRISSVLGRDINFNLIDYPKDYPASEPTRRCPSIQKAIRDLDFQPQVELNEGLRRFFSWTDKNYRGIH